MNHFASPTTETAAYSRVASSHAEAFRLGQLAAAIQGNSKEPLASAFEAWIASTGLNVWESDELRRFGPPAAIQIDHQTQMPVALWNTVPEDFSMEALPSRGVVNHFLRSTTSLFVIKSIENYPQGTTQIPVLDPHHVSVLHVVDALRGQITDVHAIRSELANLDMYAALQELCAIHQATASIAVKHLTVDQYLHWDNKLPTGIPYESIPEVISRKAATMIAHRALTLHFAAKALMREADAAERITLKTGRSIIDVLHERLSTRRENLLEIAEVLTRSLARRTVPDLSSYALHLALRTSNRRDAGPALFLVPIEASGAVHEINP